MGAILRLKESVRLVHATNVFKTSAILRLKESVRLVHAAKVRLKERVCLVYAAKVCLKERVRLVCVGKVCLKERNRLGHGHISIYMHPGIHVFYLFLMFFPQPGLPEGVLTFSIKECVRVARPSGSPAVAGRFPRPIWAGFPTSKIQIPNSKNQTIPKFKIQNLKYKVQNPKYKIQHPKSKKSKSTSKTSKV